MRRLVLVGAVAVLVVAIGIAVVFSAQVSPERCECVAFRFDDVQDYYLHDVQIRVMDEFTKRDLALTVGVIGNYFGDDQKIMSYVKEGVAAGRLEVANHGWNHESFIPAERKRTRLCCSKHAPDGVCRTRRPAIF